MTVAVLQTEDIAGHRECAKPPTSVSQGFVAWHGARLDLLKLYGGLLAAALAAALQIQPCRLAGTRPPRDSARDGLVRMLASAFALVAIALWLVAQGLHRNISAFFRIMR